MFREVAMYRLIPVIALVACQDYTFKGNNPPDGVPGDTDVERLPDIEITPAILDFGWSLIDCETDAQRVTVRNVGDADLEISRIATAGTSSGVFTFAGGAPGPTTLAPGASTQLDLVFTPTDARTYDVRLEVTSNDPDEDPAQASLLGIGSDLAMYEESFTQNDPAAVDVLWVIDNSGSMSDKVAALQDSFEVFFQSFLGLGLDFHIAATTTDMTNSTQSGRFQGNPTVIDDSMNQTTAMNAFALMTDLGSSGSGDEKGLDAAKAALTSPLIDGVNSGFLRPDAVLAVIVLSDEEDHSTISDTAFIQWLDGLKGDPEMSSFSAVVGKASSGPFQPGGCIQLFPPVSAEAGDIYIEVATQTGGMWGDICDDDLDSVVQYLSYNAAGLIREWELQYQPQNVSDIVVTVDGVEIDYDALNGFTYDSATNTIVFNGDAIPGPGEVVNVAYPIPGEC